MEADRVRQQQAATESLVVRIRDDGLIVERVRSLETALQDARSAILVLKKQTGPDAVMRAWNRATRETTIVNVHKWVDGEIGLLDARFPPAPTQEPTL